MKRKRLQLKKSLTELLDRISAKRLGETVIEVLWALGYDCGWQDGFDAGWDSGFDHAHGHPDIVPFPPESYLQFRYAQARRLPQSPKATAKPPKKESK